MRNELFTVWLPSGRTNPRVTFASQEAAENEAMRMSRVHACPAYAMGAVAAFYSGEREPDNPFADTDNSPTQSVAAEGRAKDTVPVTIEVTVADDEAQKANTSSSYTPSNTFRTAAKRVLWANAVSGFRDGKLFLDDGNGFGVTGCELDMQKLMVAEQRHYHGLPFVPYSMVVNVPPKFVASIDMPVEEECHEVEPDIDDNVLVGFGMLGLHTKESFESAIHLTLKPGIKGVMIDEADKTVWLKSDDRRSVSFLFDMDRHQLARYQEALAGTADREKMFWFCIPKHLAAPHRIVTVISGNICTNVRNYTPLAA